MPYDLAETPCLMETRFRAGACELLERARAGGIDEAGLRTGLYRLALRCRRPAAVLWERYTGGRLPLR